MSKKEEMCLLVKEWEQTRLTKSEFARTKGVTPDSFAYWVKVYKRESKTIDSTIRFFDLPTKGESTTKKIIPKIATTPINPKPQILLELSSGLKITIY